MAGVEKLFVFALAKAEKDYIDDLAFVLKESGHSEIGNAKALESRVREEGLSGYLRLSRDAIYAASWLKRYAEAVGGEG